MSGMIASFRDLLVYQKAFELQQAVFTVTRTFPREETYSLTDQVRRSSRAIGANLAEAWQKRRYPAHFVSKLSDADGEQAETRHWIATAVACGFLAEQDAHRLQFLCEEVGRMLGGMMAAPEKFCGR